MSVQQYEHQRLGEWADSSVGQAIRVVSGEGYWLGRDSHTSPISVARQYSLGIIAAGGVEAQEDSLNVPVEGFITWRREVRLNQDKFYSGVEWLDADVVLGEGDILPIPKIHAAKKAKNAWKTGKLVPIEDESLALRLGTVVDDLGPKPKVVTGGFAETDVEISGDAIAGRASSRYRFVGAEWRDKLLARILKGDVSALTEAADPALKREAAAAAWADLTQRPGREEEGPWDSEL